MQFDLVNFQQFLQTLQFQRCGCVVRCGAGGIACETLDRPPGDGLAVLLGAISVTTGVLAGVLVGRRIPSCHMCNSHSVSRLADMSDGTWEWSCHHDETPAFNTDFRLLPS